MSSGQWTLPGDPEGHHRSRFLGMLAGELSSWPRTRPETLLRPLGKAFWWFSHMLLSLVCNPNNLYSNIQKGRQLVSAEENIVVLPYRWRERWYLKVINCVCRENDLAPCGVFSELYSQLSFAGNILSFTPSVEISSSGYKTLFYTFFHCRLLISAWRIGLSVTHHSKLIGTDKTFHKYSLHLITAN